MANRLQLRRDTSTRWTSVNPILMSGEIGLETDTNKIKIGDGVKNWSQLDYFAPGSGGSSEPEIFWATYNTTTASEIQAAIDAGKVVMCKYNENIYVLNQKASDRYNLYSLQVQGHQISRIYVTFSDSSWSYTATTMQTTVERISSTSSTAPSNSNYYSALATKNLIDAVDAKIGQPVSLTFTYDDDTTQTYNLLTSNS